MLMMMKLKQKYLIWKRLLWGDDMRKITNIEKAADNIINVVIGKGLIGIYKKGVAIAYARYKGIKIPHEVLG